MAMQTSVLPSNMVAMRYRLMNIYHVTNEAGQAENFEIFKENKRLIGASHLDQKKIPRQSPINQDVVAHSQNLLRCCRREEARSKGNLHSYSLFCRKCIRRLTDSLTHHRSSRSSTTVQKQELVTEFTIPQRRAIAILHFYIITD